ncbi:MAG: peptidoglycan DD-metalloendopeptidase family protein [Pseudomonadales bacterium]|nr:peptidoglycan DD-metalloendopeptidase family protein [Pseudomonadales bacterium]
MAGIIPLIAALAFFPSAESKQNPARDYIALGPAIPANFVPPLPDLETVVLGSALISHLQLEVKPGDSLSLLFRRAGLGPQQVADITADSAHAKVLRALYPGDNLVFDLSPGQRVEALELVKTPLESWKLTRQDDGHYGLEHVLKEPEVRQVWREAVINDSLFLAAQRSSISAGMAMNLASIFNGVVDFIQDTQPGDRFGVLYEELYLDNQYVGVGRILAGEYTNQGKTHLAVRYQNSDGDNGFYSPKGEAMRKAFLLNPVDFTRISSGFSPARLHPILNTIRAHKGTDYAAPKGTPVVATADGRVTFANYNSSFGNLIVLKHDDHYETKYAHLNGYATGIKAGTRVKQGQVIGYVGATGSATGPHLHYEFLVDGVQRDSRRVLEQQEIKQMALSKDELPRFLQETQPLLASISAQSDLVRLALLDTTTTSTNNNTTNTTTAANTPKAASSASQKR